MPRRWASKRVIMLRPEQFIANVVKNYQRMTFDEFKAEYQSLNLLLITRVSTGGCGRSGPIRASGRRKSIQR